MLPKHDLKKKKKKKDPCVYFHSLGLNNTHDADNMQYHLS